MGSPLMESLFLMVKISSTYKKTIAIIINLCIIRNISNVLK
jgi:hypothetical protein